MFGVPLLLSIPYFTMSNPYPSIRNSNIMKTMIPRIATPSRAKEDAPVVPAAVKKAIIVVPPTIAAIIPKTMYKTKALILCNGYIKASLIISPKFI